MQRSLTVKDKMQTSNNIFSTFLPFSFTTARARTLSTGKSGERARPNKKCCSLLEQYHRMGSPRSSQEFFRAHTHKHKCVHTSPPSLTHAHIQSHDRIYLTHFASPPPLFSLLHAPKPSGFTVLFTRLYSDCTILQRAPSKCTAVITVQ